MKTFLVPTRISCFRSGGGISGLALAYLLNQDGLLGAPAASGAATRRPPGYNPLRAAQAALRAARQERDLAVHERRRQPLDTFDPKPALTNTPASR